MTRTFVSAAFAALLTTTALAQAQTTVKEIEVTIDIAAIENPAAAEYWGSVADDLEAAIVARLTDRIADDGVRVVIDLTELELASGFQETLNIADTRLAGDVAVFSDNASNPAGGYSLTVTYENAIAILPVGTDVTVLTPDSPEFYAAVVDTFAEQVVTRLE